MTNVQQMLNELRKKGWTVAAISDELKVNYYTVARWQNGMRSPANVAGIEALLGQLLRRRVPKKRRYTKRRPTPES